MIINEKIDGILSKLEGEFKEAVEAHRPLQEELDSKVRGLMEEFDKREETKRYEKIKNLSDYIALTLSMPLKEKTKEEIIEEIERDIDGGEVKESV